MNSEKASRRWPWICVAVLLVGAIGTGVFVTRLNELQRALAVRDDEKNRLSTEVDRLDKLAREAESRRAAADEDNRALLAALAAQKTATAESTTPSPRARTSEQVLAIYKRAGEAVLAGRFSEALALYLQCYEDGASIPTFKGARNSGVLMQLAALGEKYPPAKAALLELREAARREALRDAGKASSVDDLAAINRVLHDDNSTIDLMDSLAADDARRRSLARGSFDELVRRGRYADALKGRDQFALTSMFDLTMSQATSAPPELQERVRAGAISNATRSIEALVGAGKLSAALDLARRVLAADGSSDTLQKLRAAALKAGNPGALDAILGK